MKTDLISTGNCLQTVMLKINKTINKGKKTPVKLSYDEQVLILNFYIKVMEYLNKEKQSESKLYRN
jgi:hypothetical protein